MEAQTLIYLVVGATFALYIGIAVWSRAGSTGDFYIAGGGVHPVANGGRRLDVRRILHFHGRPDRLSRL